MLSDPVMPHLGMDPKEVIKDSHRGILTYKDGGSSIIAKGKDRLGNGTQPGTALQWNTMQLSKCRRLETDPMTWENACNKTVKKIKIGKCVWSSSTAGKSLSWSICMEKVPDGHIPNAWGSLGGGTSW